MGTWLMLGHKTAEVRVAGLCACGGLRGLPTPGLGPTSPEGVKRICSHGLLECPPTLAPATLLDPALCLFSLLWSSLAPSVGKGLGWLGLQTYSGFPLATVVAPHMYM